MSKSLLLWSGILSCIAYMASKKTIWAVVVYMFCFFALPDCYWWGGPLKGRRVSLFSGYFLLGMLIFHRITKKDQPTFLDTIPEIICVLMLINALFVHFALAPRRSVSANELSQIFKFVLLYFMIHLSIKDAKDLDIFMVAIFGGFAWTAYNIQFNDYGDIISGRLENIPLPAVSGANQGANFAVSITPLAGYFLFSKKRWRQVFVVYFGPQMVNFLLKCNSRGGFLACLLQAVCSRFVQTGVPGKKTFRVAIFAIIAAFGATWLFGDARVIKRFETTFASEEDRDGSASHRLLFWGAAIEALQDYPLGSGGSGWKYVRAPEYLARVGYQTAGMSCHNGFLAEPNSWGLQGLFLKMLLIAVSCWMTFRVASHQALHGNEEVAHMGSGSIVCVIGFLASSFFGDFLDSEWIFWHMALQTAYVRIHGKEVYGGATFKPNFSQM